MLIVFCLYLGLAWLLFGKFKILQWNWTNGSITSIVGVIILCVFLGLFNYFTPTGRFVIGARVVEVTPNVGGQIISVPVTPNKVVERGEILFQVDPAPFQYKVKQLEASLVSAQFQALQLISNFDQATANVDGMTKALAYHSRRLEDTRRLLKADASTAFREQDIRNQVDSATYQLAAAKAAQESAKHALASEVDGVNSNVANIQSQLESAKWELEQTTIRAPMRGYVSSLALTKGDRATPASSVLSFVESDDTKIIALFSPNGFETITEGTRVKLVFDNRPGRVFQSEVTSIPRAVGQGQIAVSGLLAKTDAIRGVETYPAVIAIPSEIAVADLRLGMPGSATAFSADAGVIGLIRSVLVWISSYLAYL